MRSSQQWWNEVKASPELFNDWLVKQYRGEVTAANRIARFADQYESQYHNVLAKIADQEAQHAEWIEEILTARGIEVDASDIQHAEDRYWKETLPGIDSFETGAAVAAHAEAMRLERIEVICNDPESPKDVRDTFRKILKDELFHEKAFRFMAGKVAMDATQGNHDLGLQALGLVH
jgi:rubrerythrin